MATHDYVIDNSTGANVRADINNALAAIVSNNSSSSEPSTKYAYQWWADTTNGILKIRNSANNDWVELLQLDGTLTLEDGSASTPGLAFRDDLNTGIFSSAADTFNVATGGTERMELGTTTIFNEDGADVDFRIEGDSEANLFYVDAGNDRIGIGENTPSVRLHIKDTETTGGVGIKLTNVGEGGSNTVPYCFINANLNEVRNGGEIRFGRDSNYGDAANADSFMAFYTALNDTNTERMRITSDGKVGIGTTSPSCTGLNVSVNTTTTSRVSENTVQIQNTNNGASTCAGIVLACSTGANTEFNIVTQKHSSGSGADFFLDNGTNARMEMSGDNGDIKFGVGGTMINTFTPGLSNTTIGIGLEPRNGSIFLSRSDGAALYINTNTDGAHLASFRRNGNEQGKIIAHSSSVSYETTSDYRLKENAVAISDGITRLKQLKPYKFNFKSNSSETLDGFFAHEAQTVVPECASGTKDQVVVQAQVDSEVYKEEELGNPIYQGIDQSKLVPLLVAAVQELITKVETLEAA